VTPAQLSQWASVPCDLAELVFQQNARWKTCGIKRLRSSDRTTKIVRVRWAIAKAAVGLGYTYSEVGRALNRDHSSIMYAVGAVRK
jgi:chromosomal replication initiation ATPase DnaA